MKENVPPFVESLSRMSDDMTEQSERLQNALLDAHAFNHGFAHVIFDKLIRLIYDFEQRLSADEEVGAYLSSFGQSIFIVIDKVSYEDPYFIIFDGLNIVSGATTRLIQHTSQTNVLLTVVQVKPDQKRKGRRVGFLPSDE